MNKVEKLIDNIILKIVKINAHVNKKYRRIINTIMFFLLIVVFCITSFVGVEQTRMQIRIVTIAIMGLILLIAIFNITVENKSKHYNKIMVGLWYSMCLLMIVVSLINKNIDKLIVPFGIGIVFPLFSLALNSKTQRTEIFQSFSNALAISLIFFSLISILFVPMTEYQFAGVFANCNFTAQYLTCVLVAMLYKVLTNHIMYTIPLGISMVFIWFTASRTGILATIIVFLACILFMVFGYKKNSITIKYYIKAVVMIILSFFVWLNAYIIVNNYCKNTIQAYFSINAEAKIMSERNQNIEDYNYDAKSVLVKSQRRYNMGDVDLNRYSTGRISIWKAYIAKTNLMGHAEPVEGYSTAHNTFIQFVYDYGLIVGVIYIIEMIYVCVMLLKKMIKNPSVENNFYAMTAGNYLATSLVASIGMPFGYFPSLIFNMVFWDIISLNYEDDNNEFISAE